MSAVSRATGADSDAPARRNGSGAAKKTPRKDRSSRTRKGASGPLEITLEHARWRHFGWAAFGAVAGVLLLIKLGAVGKIVGGVLCVAALPPLRNFVMTLLHAPGAIRVETSSVTLPRGLCRGEPVVVDITDVHHAFFLRRAVPWTRTGPLLVVEAADHAFIYPRDWFASESDQRRVADTINRHLEGEGNQSAG